MNLSSMYCFTIMYQYYYLKIKYIISKFSYIYFLNVHTEIPYHNNVLKQLETQNNTLIIIKLIYKIWQYDGYNIVFKHNI